MIWLPVTIPYVHKVVLRGQLSEPIIELAGQELNIMPPSA